MMMDLYEIIVDSIEANVIALEYMRRCPNEKDEKIVMEKLASVVKCAHEFFGMDCSNIPRYFSKRKETEF